LRNKPSPFPSTPPHVVFLSAREGGPKGGFAREERKIRPLALKSPSSRRTQGLDSGRGKRRAALDSLLLLLPAGGFLKFPCLSLEKK